MQENMASGQDVKFMAGTILDVPSAADSIVNYADSRRLILLLLEQRGEQV
ncbi:MAG: hypothetical protein M3270_01835 [Thermoproteota archaeon]|nr:hypothetical protein [Thermoproteota archaeon]